MGHRDDLLAGAKKCIVERGYARTTARDIVEASGANLASIGYHYGSKEILLNKALVEAIGDSAEMVGQALSPETDEGASPIERFETIWSNVVEQFVAHRQLWLASLEILAQVDHVPEVREALVQFIRDGREGMAQMFQYIADESGSEVDEETVHTAGSFFQALATGVMTQWLIDPERAPDGKDLSKALRMMMSWQSGETEHVAARPGRARRAGGPQRRAGTPRNG